MKKAIKVRCRTALLAAVAAFCAAADAAEFSKAGYWEAEGSPRRVETLTTGWEFSLDGFKTSKTATKSDDARLREVERQQHDFEAGRPQ